MKLAIIYHQFIHAGGLENYLIEFCRQLQQRGHQLHLVTARHAPEVTEKLPGAQWHMIQRPSGSALLRMAWFDYAAGVKGNDLGCDLSLGFGRSTRHDLHRAGGGCHRLYSKLLPWWKRYAPKNLLELSLEKRLYNGGGTRHFVLNSARVAAQIQGLYPGARDKCSVIHTAVDTEHYQPAEDRASVRAALCQELATDMAKPIGLFVSLSHRRKGLDALLQAWRSVDATLWIAGKKLTPRYTALIEQLGLRDKVRAFSPSGLQAYYQAADWFVHPTLYDACANTVLQSMASGLPGLISNQDGAVDHIRDGENGFMLYHPQRVPELAQRLQQAFALPEPERQALGHAARQTMLPLTWQAHVDAWEGLAGALK